MKITKAVPLASDVEALGLSGLVAALNTARARADAAVAQLMSKRLADGPKGLFTWNWGGDANPVLTISWEEDAPAAAALQPEPTQEKPS